MDGMTFQAATEVPAALAADQQFANCFLEYRPAPEESCVYFLLKDGAVIYVGKSRSLQARIASHQSDKDFDRILILACEPSVLDEVEQYWIRKLQPPLNSDHTLRRKYGNSMAGGAMPYADACERFEALCDSPEPSSIVALDMPDGVKKALVWNRIETVDDLCGLSELGLYSLRSIGSVAVRQIKTALEKVGRTVAT